MSDFAKEKNIILTQHSTDLFALKDCFQLCIASDDHETNKQVRRMANALVKTNGGSEALELYYNTHLFDAKDSLDSYILYTEHNREISKQFYLPRRKQLKTLVDAMQSLEERKIDLLGISLPPGIGKSTLAEFFLTWTAGKHPDKQILTGSHSNSFLRGMYGEIIRMLDANGEYCWNTVFPELKVISTNAQDMMIDIGEDKRLGKRFATFEFSSIGSGNAGKVRATNLLYCDDLVDGLESALSKERMDKLYNMYAVDLRQRKIGDFVAELQIATRWSIHDPLGRLERLYSENDKAKFIKVPAVDDNDESNFNYPYGLGYTTEMLHEQRNAMDDASWRALFMNEPIEREGQLYPEDEFRRYFELPDSPPDGVLAVTDTKDTGKDFCCMVIAYQYGNDFYIEDVVYENYAPHIIDEQLVMKLLKHKVQMCQFESNAAGGRTADKVQEKVKAQGGRTKITKKWTTANKDTKILVNSPFVKEHFLFKDNTILKQEKEYRAFLNALCGYTLAGRNAHDDAPDAVAQLSEYVQSMFVRQVTVFQRPF